MNRRLFLHWVVLSAILTAVGSVLLTLRDDNAASAATKAQTQDSGAFRVIDKNGKPNLDCPLKHTSVKAEVSGFMSRVTVTQDFENPFADKIEAVYTFPLPDMAAVDDLTMQIGDRTIKGKIMRRDDAAAAYAAAKQLGRVASLLDQERPNIFTQQVANILPGQQIRVTISYVETLKYEDGSYAWTFPMVVAPRYNTGGNSKISPPRMPEGMRAGHDVSLEINLDAGVPIASINSTSHEIDVQKVDEKRAVVRLKDNATIPNKDFLLTYGIAGDTIKDAVLAHHSDRGGFFTLILQPPQRVQAEDVMPKEMVFVLDTSGSMRGSPFDTAKQTMELALNTLYPHDTFNLITFSGDTEVLFPQPVPATRENLRSAKEFLSSRESAGGTEMMKAIKAALDPSDSQYHVRFACFMTDGKVGNDQEILAEVQKHQNARVFAMGFGDAPNRALLDKMTQYGRGEVDYVSITSNSSTAAQRFNDRIRNPLLTDLSIEWTDLSITEVFPKRIPDLFSVKPLIISGRYTTGGKGKIRLKGKMAGQDFIREIPVELPEVEKDHEALGTLWARHKIDDLTAEEIALAGDQSLSEEKRKEIVELGLTFKLMTQYTSFVAVDEVIFTGSEEPRRVEVPVEAIPGSIATGLTETVTVTSSGSSSLQYCLVATAPTRTIRDLPLQGRSFIGLLSLIPGTAADSGPSVQPSRNSTSMKGQTTNFVIDGVDAKFGISPGGESPGASASGNAPALTASGGANGIVTMDATQEVYVETQWSHEAFTRGQGPRIEVNLKSGTNYFHGSASHFFGNDAFDAGDWVANSRGLNKPPKRLNLFGASLGGPIHRNQTFFFAAYEGLRLRQPVTGVTDVPSLSARQAAPDVIRPFLEAFPRPTGVARADGFAEFTATYANAARHDVGSLLIDHWLTQNSKLRGRYNFAESEATQRGANGFSLNTTNQIRTHSQSVSGSLMQNLSPNAVIEFNTNYSRMRVNGAYLLDQFGGATIAGFNPSQSASFAFDLNSRNAGLMIGDDTRNIQRKLTVGGAAVIIFGNHSVKFGTGYRRLSPILSMRARELNVLFDGVAQATAGTPARSNNLIHSGPQTPVFESVALYGEDLWKQSPRFTLSFGLRWQPAPAPSNHQAFAVDQVNDPSNLKLAAPGTPLWNTTFGNFAPHGGFAYQLVDPTNGDFVLRGGVTVFYDRGHDRSGDVFGNSIPFVSGSSFLNSTTVEALPLLAYDPQLTLPYSLNWNVGLEKSLGSAQSLNVSYLGASGRRLLHTETLFDRNPDFAFLRITTNRARSEHHALNVTFERLQKDGFAALASYTWSRSTDNAIYDSDRNIIMTSADLELDYGPSDFDREHELTGFMSYDLPSPFAKGLGNTLLRKWHVDSIFTARSAKPLGVLYMFPTSIGVAYFRPDFVDGTPLYVSDPAAPEGRRINQAAFTIPAALQQGTLGRNSLRGFPLYQIDLGLRRKFHFTDEFFLQVQADAFNLFNRANFEDLFGNDVVVGTLFRSNSAFGQSTSLSGRGLSSGGFASFYGRGGARTMRFSLKLVF